jgi:hypothetical protein
MTLVFMPPGNPGDNKGVSHTLKHYLAPDEVWEDVAQNIPTPYRPVATLMALELQGHPSWNHWGRNVTPHEVDAWPLLSSTYEHGYKQVIAEYFASGLEHEVRRARMNPPVRIAHLGDGIIIHRYDNGPHLRTAYRSAGVILHTAEAYARIPRTLDALSRRLKQARSQATRKLALTHDSDPT